MSDVGRSGSGGGVEGGRGGGGGGNDSIATQVAVTMSHVATCLATLRKVEDFSCNLQCNIFLRCELRRGDVTRAIFPATCLATSLRDELQEMLHRVTWPILSNHLYIECYIEQ